MWHLATMGVGAAARSETAGSDDVSPQDLPAAGKLARRSRLRGSSGRGPGRLKAPPGVVTTTLKKASMAMKKSGSGSKGGAGGDSPSRLIDARIEELSGWRGETLARLRLLIRQADPEIVEEWKWSVPVWSRAGVICTGEAYKNVVKLTFAKGASLDDPEGLFNSSLEGNTRRAIDIREGDRIDEQALQALVRAASALNASRARTET